MHVGKELCQATTLETLCLCVFVCHNWQERAHHSLTGMEIIQDIVCIMTKKTGFGACLMVAHAVFLGDVSYKMLINDTCNMSQNTS